eukprot:CAMPEP_0201524816 /NCGR_PEP_ID=MMETSP0161_2-20130828/25361_1 /ASSEMBLY_ACC=CAM_ASM_000251 /TAXON_ID=180227 /ORGANISM="Neoparamoeba aestuarina, Strain SoJaBio B1-5/56/2" /LENGTH=903 /DNA_ID=CAMNT_0047924409 /DNA_START=630 /DNA_END=3341 /DNA_ORIENTATION=+
MLLLDDRVCVSAAGWEDFDENTYTFDIVATSNLFNEDSLTTSLTFSLSYSADLGKKRQVGNVCESLWDTEILFGIRTYPSGHSYLPANMRDEGVTVQLKALTACDEFVMNREILENSTITWEIIDKDSIDVSDASTRLLLSSSDLTDRDTFPVATPVSIYVEMDVGGLGERILTSEFSFEFMPGPVEFELDDDPGYAFQANEQLVLDFSDSETTDGIETDDGTWEWEWRCEEALTGDPCRYSNGDTIDMPSGPVFSSNDNRNFEVEVPLMFSVQVRVTFGDMDELTSLGQWLRVINPISTDDIETTFELLTWRCLTNNKDGYSFSYSPDDDSEIESTAFETLWAPNTNDFGEVEVIDIESSSDELAEFKCSCSASCGEPVFVRLTLTFTDSSTVSIYQIYQPPPSLSPHGGSCSAVTSTLGEDVEDDVVSLLSFIFVECTGWEFADGLVSVLGERVYFAVEDEGEGEVENPLTYPPKRTLFGNQQMLVPCGTSVAIFVEIVGFGETSNFTTFQRVADLQVDVWVDSEIPRVDAAIAEIDDSPNAFLKQNYIFSSIKTTSSDCGEGAYVPVDPDDVLDDILDSDPPDDIDEVLDEAPIIAVIAGDDPDDIDDIIDRFEDYLDVINDQGDLDDAVDIIGSILDGVSNILDATDDQDILNDIYDLIGNAEGSLLCLLNCGEDPVVIESDAVTVGASAQSLASLASRPIFLGDSGVAFLLPEDTSEIEESLGIEEGSCVLTGTSVINSGDNENPVASFSFYVIDCATGVREEVMITLDGQFTIIIPSGDRPSSDDGCGGEVDDVPSCVSGTTLTETIDTDGCELLDDNGTHIFCGCSHLTAFSALFVPGEGGDCEWEWDILHTVAVSLLAFSLITVSLIILVEHNFVFKKRKQRIKEKTKTKKSRKD